MENVKNYETITKLDAKGIKKALMEFADFDIDERNEIFKIQRTHFHRLKELHKDFSNETLSQCAKIGNTWTQFPEILEQCLHFYLNTIYSDYLNTFK